MSVVGHIKRICLDSNIAKHLIEKKLSKKIAKKPEMPNFVRLNEGGVTFHFLSGAVKAKQQN